MTTPWACQRSGDCCRAVDEVVMTHEERAEVERAAGSRVSLTFEQHTDSRFARLLAQTPLSKRKQ